MSLLQEIAIKNNTCSTLTVELTNDDKIESHEITPLNDLSINSYIMYKYLYCNDGVNINSTKLCEDFYYQRIILTSIFGPRPACSIKVFMACLAGPADPTVRNDILLIDKFKSIGVPQENTWLLLEKQCTPKNIKANLENMIYCTNECDIIFIYLGGHGNNSNNQYNLCTYDEYTTSTDVLDILTKTKAEVFLIVDSCYSGQIINDFQAYEKHITTTYNILTSTYSNMSAYTGWKLIQLLIDVIFNKDETKAPSILEICKYIQDNLITSLKEQKANHYYLIK